MRKSVWVLFIASIIPLRADVGVRILLGLTDTQPTTWDGSVTVDRGRITKLDPWRFGKDDDFTGEKSWKVTTAPVLSFLHLIARQKAPLGSNGVVVWLSGEDENTNVKVSTAQGEFAIRLGDIPYGKFAHALDGRASADRIPPTTQLTNSTDEQDYPAAAIAPNRDVWVAYVEFKHNPNYNELRYNYKEAPKDFSGMIAPPGGDQVLVKRLRNNQWSEPIAVTRPGADLYRPAIAVDGSGRPWVFWSENIKGNFDVYARPIDDTKPGGKVQISKAPGADVFPVAATDSKGKVWVAWQGWRDGKAAIFASAQQDGAFSAPVAVSSSQANEWNPSIAADSAGQVSVAWDSYRNGSYDVYVRTAASINSWKNEIPVAATARYEAYPSIAYDKKGRLWIAYEESAEGWGKDFGAHRSTGVSLYQSRVVRVVGLDPSGTLVDAGADLGAVLPGVPEMKEEFSSRQAASGLAHPNADLWSQRKPNDHPWPKADPRNSLPRLTVDPSGRLWLAFRSSSPSVWGPLGTVWSEFVTSFDGAAWTNPVYLFRSDNILDNRPALVSRTGGDLLVIESSDYRREVGRLLKKGWDLSQFLAFSVPDPYNNDLFASVVTLPPAPGPIAGRSLGPVPEPARISPSAADDAATAKVRAYRIGEGGRNLKIARGEFHRHSEISVDGGLDGTLIDQWRYIIDAASMDWVGCCDHDNGSGREYSWWTTQKLTDIFHSPGKFESLFSYERSVSYPEGHRNVVFAQRGVRPLPRLPKTSENEQIHAPDTQMFYSYLRKYNGVVASHTSATDMGTDWRDNDPDTEPIVEIYQGMRQNYEIPDGPRSNSAQDSIGGWRPKGFVNLALQKGYKLGFQASSDHISTHQSYANILVENDTREALVDALRKRHVYASTEQIIADVRSGPHLMGDAFSTNEPPEISVKLIGTANFSKVVIVKDNKYVYSSEPGTKEVTFRWRDNAFEPGKTSYYYVRGEQQDGELVWASPFWITYTGK